MHAEPGCKKQNKKAVVILSKKLNRDRQRGEVRQRMHLCGIKAVTETTLLTSGVSKYPHSGSCASPPGCCGACCCCCCCCWFARKRTSGWLLLTPWSLLRSTPPCQVPALPDCCCCCCWSARIKERASGCMRRGEDVSGCASACAAACRIKADKSFQAWFACTHNHACMLYQSVKC